MSTHPPTSRENAKGGGALSEPHPMSTVGLTAARVEQRSGKGLSLLPSLMLAGSTRPPGGASWQKGSLYESMVLESPRLRAGGVP